MKLDIVQSLPDDSPQNNNLSRVLEISGSSELREPSRTLRRYTSFSKTRVERLKLPKQRCSYMNYYATRLPHAIDAFASDVKPSRRQQAVDSPAVFHDIWRYIRPRA